jgi:AraC family transcriptional regulator
VKGKDIKMDINIVFNNVINYIEENLRNDISYEEAAKMMGVSVFHFQRLFSFLTGIPIAEYIRYRRMTLAGFDIQKSNEKIIDIALRYHYESHSSFSRAFQLFHGVNPSAVRDEGVSIKVYPPINLHITVQGNDEINFRIVKTESYQLFGKDDIIVPMEHKYALDFIKDYGNMVVENGSHAAINVAAGYPVDGRHPFHLLHGIYFKDSECKTHFMYGWEKPTHKIEECFTVIDVPKTTWAVFTYYGNHMEGLPKIWTYIYTSWLYTSGYRTEDYIIIEKESWHDDNQKIICAEVWMPIKD